MGYQYEITTTRGAIERGDVHEEHVGAQGAAETAIFQMDWTSVRIVNDSAPADEDEIPVTFYVIRWRDDPGRFMVQDPEPDGITYWADGWTNAHMFLTLDHAQAARACLDHPDRIEIRRIVLRSEAVST